MIGLLQVYRLLPLGPWLGVFVIEVLRVLGFIDPHPNQDLVLSPGVVYMPVILALGRQED